MLYALVWRVEQVYIDDTDMGHTLMGRITQFGTFEWLSVLIYVDIFISITHFRVPITCSLIFRAIFSLPLLICPMETLAIHTIILWLRFLAVTVWTQEEEEEEGKKWIHAQSACVVESNVYESSVALVYFDWFVDVKIHGSPGSTHRNQINVVAQWTIQVWTWKLWFQMYSIF